MAEPVHSGSIDTGTGGFGIDGKVYTYDVGVTNGGGPQGNVDHKDVKVDQSVKDLSKPTKVTLANYLSELTKGKRGDTQGVPNKYPVDPDLQEVKLSGDKGNPSPLRSAPNNSVAFAPTPPDPYSSSYSSIHTKIKKGKSSAPVPDGNDLLPTGDAEPIKTYRATVLTANRFTDAAMLDSNKFGTTVSHQTKLGEYDSKAARISQGRLAQVGPVLTLRAGIELGSGDADANANSGGTEAGAILPGVAQLAVRRVDEIMLHAKDILDGLTGDEVPDANVISPGGLSWGALNNTNDQFSGIAALGMAALSTALVAGLLLVIDGFSLILGLIKPGSVSPARDQNGRYALGAYYYSAKKKNDGGLLGAANALLSLDIGSLLGIQPTHYPFSAALKKGSNAFFGIDDSGGVLGQLAGAASKGLSADAGFNAIVARTIIRSTLTIIDQIKKIGGNPINIVKQILGLIDVLKTSKIIAACNVFARLGDAILSVPDAWTDPDTIGAGTKISQMDLAGDETSAVARSRLKGSLKLAWANNRSPSNLLLSKAIAGASSLAGDLGAFKHDVVYKADQSESRSSEGSVSPARISPDDAMAMEGAFDAEYVPFYFHDVRTNEMVGFHAFLASLSDDYAANYESVEAYGRVEPVKIYKGTTRKISMSFYVVATSHNDFDDMWVKLNKLVTLVYPQFTAGKQLSDEKGDYVFTQPFSQLIGASPLVRIRLGDLMRSNYSRFNLARLFGLGNKETVFNQKSMDIGSGHTPGKLAETIEKYKKTSGKTFIAAGRSYSLAPPTSAGGGLGLPVPNPLGGSGGDGPKNSAFYFGREDLEVKIVKVNPDDPSGKTVIGEVQIPTDPDMKKILDQPGNQGMTRITYLKSQFDNGDQPTNRTVGGQYIFPLNALTPTNQTKKAADVESAGSTSADVQELANFMDPEKNAVVKSFKDTGGKGLAGFIDSMNFDWYDKVTWETSNPGRTAPKMCKVTISFSPIHDIAPGLDHLGINRAPVYPVGQMAPLPDKLKK